MIDNAEFVETAAKTVEEKWGYIWGTSGQLWTAQKQANATREQTVRYGKKWIGHKVADCSGLVLWAVKQFGETVYHGSNSQWRHDLSEKGELEDGKRTDGGALLPGMLVFKNREGDRYHVGIYAGGETVIEAKGTQAGVVTSNIREWDEWGALLCVDYHDGKAVEFMLEKGDRGEAVRTLQKRLNALGFDSGAVDGIFGTKTENAVLAFQEANGIAPTGRATEATLTALYRQAETPAEAEPEENMIDSITAELLEARGHIDKALEELARGVAFTR